MAIYAANWKMNILPSKVQELVTGILGHNSSDSDQIILCPPSVYLQESVKLTRHSHIAIGAQNTYFEVSGAYTGEVSAQMVAELGASYVIVGHSERRQLFGDTDEMINKKISASLDASLTPILCIGETLDQRESEDFYSILDAQIVSAISGYETDLANSDFLIAYEPVWAIGTGKVASPEQAQDVHAFIRSKLQSMFKDKQIPILYGGSVKPTNAGELLEQKDIDGFLVGGASLSVDDFTAIMSA